MLSYRHAFHAGNHADVLKHLMLVQVLEHFNRKDAPYWYVDTHAGAGQYALDSGAARKLDEAQTGILRLAGQGGAPEAVRRYLEVAGFAQAPSDHYPGSPEFAYRLMRADDALRLFELHPTDSGILKAHFARAGKRVQVRVEDGFAALKSVLPPPTRRAVVLIDPPYEVKRDYDTLISSLEAAFKRFATGCYLVWYPILSRPESVALPARLQQLAGSERSWLHARLTTTAPRSDGLGMTGSGMFVFNPPYTLPGALEECLPYLAEQLGEGAGAGYSLDGHQH